MPGPIKVILRRESDSNKALVDLTGPRGESESGVFELPWLDETEWQAVFLSLELLEKDPKTWPQGKVRQKAQELGLFLQDRPSDDRFKIIGRQLFDAVFGSEEIRSLLERLLHMESEIPVIEFHVRDEGSILQAYPWELLCDDEGFLFEGKRAFPVRHVDFREPITRIELSEILSVLYNAPRPDMSSYEGYANLPVRERLHLEYLNRYYPDHLALESLPAKTLDALHKHLMGSKKPVHVIHIDTHGDFGWLCQCKRLNPPKAEQCSQCEKPRSSDQEGRGYLAFEIANGNVDWVSGDDLGKRLRSRGVQVVVLSACRSALVGGKSIFNSTACALVKQRVPAVVSMQFSIGVKQAEKFTEFLYWALMKGITLVEAVAEARIALSKDSWYRPVLYLRTDVSNYRGKIFEPKSPLGPPKKLGLREKWIARLGFKRDPFLYTDGEKDPYLQEYFYFGMRHFYHIRGDISRPGTIFVFGPPGSGKSSLRNVIAQLCRKEGILPVVYWDFGSLVRKCEKGESVQAEDYVSRILKTAIRTLAGDLETESAEEGKEATSLQEIEQAKIARNQLWLYVSRYEDDPHRRQTLGDWLKPDEGITEDLPTDSRQLLGRFCENVTRLSKYKFVYILIDPDITSEDVAWQVLEPLLSTHRLLELSEDNVGFKFFLSKEFRHRALQIPWIEQEQSKRVYNLEWPDDELRALLKERLRQCSDGRYESLGQLSEVDGLDDQVIQFSKGSPRELIAICDRLFSEHCRRWSPEDGEPLLITGQEVKEVLEPFAERHKESALEQLIAQGESSRLELKSTMRYNQKTGRRDEEMDKEIARTLCAFMNTEGGTLIIGVDDDGMALGLDDDFSTLGRRRNRDGLAQAFANITKHLFVPSVLQKYYTARFEQYQGKSIYVVEVEKSEEPVFCLFDGVREFYIRELTTTRKLDAKDTLDYCLGHFE
jgi:energy-coupling factor transporter ATP-binding protein EcfA2